MSDEQTQVRLHSLHVTGDLTDPVAMRAAIEHAVAEAVSREQPGLESRVIGYSVAREISGEVAR